MYEASSGVPRNFVRGVQQIQLRTEDRENGDLGAVAPQSVVLEAAVIWYKKFHFVQKNFLNFWYFKTITMINLFVIAIVKQLRADGSFRILLPFFPTTQCVGVLNSAIFNCFHNRVEFGTILEGLWNFGCLNPPPSVRQFSLRLDQAKHRAGSICCQF